MILTTSGSLVPHDPALREWVYNALDAAVTAEVAAVLLPRIAADPDVDRTYRFERALQAPAMAMQLRGFGVDDIARQRHVRDLVREAAPLQRKCDEIAEGATAAGIKGEKFKWGKGLAPSTHQLQKVIYGAMGVPYYRADTGEVSLGKEILEKIRKKHPVARELCDTVLTLRDMQEQVKTSQATLEPDGRMRYQVSVGQQETGRWSCTKSVWRTGTNMHGITHRLRSAFVPEPGMVLINADLEQAESRCVAYLARDEAYIEAHERGNVHVEAARLAWPTVAWTGDGKADKTLAKETAAWWVPQPPAEPGAEAAVSLYRLAKVLQHGNNYGQTYRGVARRLGMSDREGERVSEAYHGRYPGIRRYHGEIKSELLATGVIVTPFGRPRQFFGRHWEWETIKEAIAHVPQSLTSDILKTVLHRIWSEWDPEQVEVLMEAHDAVVMQARPEWVKGNIDAIKSMFRVEVPIHGRTMVIPVEVQIGPRSWGELMSVGEWRKQQEATS